MVDNNNEDSGEIGEGAPAVQQQPAAPNLINTVGDINML